MRASRLPIARALRIAALSTLSVLPAIAASPLARADVPVCKGNEPGVARRQVEDGKQHYRHALSQTTVDADEMSTALAEFDSACAAGDGSVLELRAYALFALKRYVDAAESLDAFLKTSPLASLPKNVHDRVLSQRPSILANVAMLRVVANTPNARVSVGGRAPAPAPVEVRVLADEPVEISVAVPGGVPVNRTVTLVAGTFREESFAVGPAQAVLTVDAPPGAEVSIDGTSIGRAPLAPVKHDPGPVDVSVTQEGGQPVVHHLELAAGEARVERFTSGSDAEGATASRPLTKWVIATGVSSFVALGAGIGFSLWRSERTSTYNASCLVTEQPAGCAETLSQYKTAVASQIAAFSVSGALAVTAVVLLVLDRKAASAHVRPALSFTCVPGPGIACGGTF